MMETICASGGGINWCWYTWFEFDRATGLGNVVRSDRFHRFDESQGAGDHPETGGWSIQHTSARPSGWQLEDDRAAFWQEGWERNCRSQGLDPQTTAQFWLLRNGAETLRIVKTL